MPSPMLHTTAGYVVYRIYRDRLPQSFVINVWKIPKLLMITLIFSMLPDMDSVFGILSGNFARYHNNATHSLIVGLLVALIAGGLAAMFSTISFRLIFLVTFLSYAGHVLLDFFTISRGVMALWPLSWERFASPLPLFYGLHWSDGIISIRHIWTFLTESATAALFILAIRYLTSGSWRGEDPGGETRRVTGASEER